MTRMNSLLSHTFPRARNKGGHSVVARSAAILAIALVLSPGTQAAQQPCNADQAIQGLEGSAKSMVNQLPVLMKEIDNCFNLVDHPDHAQEAKKLFNMMIKEYKDSVNQLSQAYQSLKSGHDAEFKSSVDRITNRIQEASQPLFKYAGNFKSYGFTISDSKVNGEFKYPNCNSSKNNSPEQKWAAVYQTAMSVQKANQRLLATASCLK